MSYHVFAGQSTEGNIIDIFQNSGCYIQTGFCSHGKILLGGVTRYDHFGAETDTGQEHFHLCRCGILCFIQNNIGIVQCPASHIGKRCHFDQTLFHIFGKTFRSHDLIQGIVQGTQIRVYLTLQITGQKAQLFSGFNGRSGQDDTAHLVVLKSGDRHGHGQIRLTGTSRSQSEYDHVFPDGIHISLLPQGLGLDRLSADGMADAVRIHLHQFFLLVFFSHFNGIIHALFFDLIAVIRQCGQLS